MVVGILYCIVVLGDVALSTHGLINHDIYVTIYSGTRRKTTTYMSHLRKAHTLGTPGWSDLSRVMSSIFQAGLLTSRFYVWSYVKYIENSLIPGVFEVPELCQVYFGEDPGFQGILGIFPGIWGFLA